MTSANRSKLQPLDRWALNIILCLTIAIALLLWSGDRTWPQVRNFSWQERTIGADDTAFTLTFNRSVDRAAVAKQLKIQTPLTGKMSWAGSKMAYTLERPAPYGNRYQIDLAGVAEEIGTAKGKNMLPFRSTFQTPDPLFAYISSGSADRGRVAIYNFRTKKSTLITPANLIVNDFKLDRANRIVVFSAVETAALAQNQPTISVQQIYSIGTGIPPRDPELPAIGTGKLELILDNREYQNAKFDLAPDGNKIVVQRVGRKNPGDFALWLVPLTGDRTPRKLKQSGNFTISPDSSQIAAAVGEGVSIFPLEPSSRDNLDFLPKFGNVLSFANDGTAAAMVEYNSDYTRSLFTVDNNGIEQQVLKTNGSIIDAIFAPAKDIIYCLATELATQANNTIESPYLTAIDLKTKKPLFVLPLPAQQNVQMSLAADGRAVIFDRTNDGDANTAANTMWLLPIPDRIREMTASIRAEQLPISGWHPLWLH